MNTHASLGMHKMFDKFNIDGKVYAMISTVESAFSSVKQLINTWATRSMNRNQLARLDARMLRDIGLEPYQVEVEINKPFWRA